MINSMVSYTFRSQQLALYDAEIAKCLNNEEAHDIIFLDFAYAFD